MDDARADFVTPSACTVNTVQDRYQELVRVLLLIACTGQGDHRHRHRVSKLDTRLSSHVTTTVHGLHTRQMIGH